MTGKRLKDKIGLLTSVHDAAINYHYAAIKYFVRSVFVCVSDY